MSWELFKRKNLQPEDDSLQEGEKVTFKYRGREHSGTVLFNHTAFKLGFMVETELPSEKPDERGNLVKRALNFKRGQLTKQDGP